MLNSSFYFVIALVNPKTKFRLIGFSKIFKPKVSHLNSSFRKSLSRFSYKISTKLAIKLSTLAKIKNKIFIKNFIFNLYSKNKWLTFNQIDILDRELRATGRIKKQLCNLTNLKKNDIEIILTN